MSRLPWIQWCVLFPPNALHGSWFCIVLNTFCVSLLKVQNQKETVPADDPSNQTPQGDAVLSSTASSSSTHFLNLDDSLASGLSGLSDFNRTGLWFMSPQQFSAIAKGIAQSDDQQVCCMCVRVCVHVCIHAYICTCVCAPPLWYTRCL